MRELENGWHLCSDGYMTSECSYQRITAMKGNRALDNHGKLVFIKFMGGKEADSRVYLPHPGECEMHESSEYVECKVQTFTCSACGWHGAIDDLFASDTNPNFCPNCGCKVVER